VPTLIAPRPYLISLALPVFLMMFTSMFDMMDS
jgi:hypothetical protein